MGMNVIDITILSILVAFTVKGLFRGFLKELCSLLGLIAGAVLAFSFHAPLAEMLAQYFQMPPRIAVFVAFLLLFLATVVFFSLLGYALSRFLKLLFLGGLNRVAGGFFGLLQGVLLLTMTLFSLSLTPLPKTVQPAFKGSILSPPFVNLGETVLHGSRQAIAEWL
jgi:membrane protein required for colicin V production